MGSTTSLLRPTILKRTLFFMTMDLGLSFITLFFAYQLRFNFQVPPQYMEQLPSMFAAIGLLKLASLYYFNIYNIPWRFFSLDSFEKLLKAHLTAYLLFAGLAALYTSYVGAFPRSVVIIDLFLSIVFIGALRVAKRLYLESGEQVGTAALIVGVTKAGELAARYLDDKETDLHPVAFLDDNPAQEGNLIRGMKVYGYRDLAKVVETYSVGAAVIAAKLSPEQLDDLFERLKAVGIEKVKMVRMFGEDDEKIKDISIEDLLARKPKDLDKTAIGDFIRGKKVLITGAGGSIGSEIARQCAAFGASGLVLVDNGEYNLYAIGEELGGFPHVCRMVSVTDAKRMEKIFARERPELVIHAAAYKHVPLVEENVEAAVENNILGTKLCIDLAIKYKANEFVLISTDKAVRPTNVMGATKRVCELYAQNVDAGETRIVAVRFGNVLGSSGSVVPKFRAQIEAGGPVTVTHPEVTRYFMLIAEACELVLQAASLAKGGEVFILDMGEPVKIVDLAKKMLLLSNREDIQIEFTGLRPGEKLFEELLLDERDKETKYPSIFVGRPTAFDIDALNGKIVRLLESEEKTPILKEIVPEFNHNGKENG